MFRKGIAAFAISLSISLVGLLFGVAVPIYLVVVPALFLGQLAPDSKQEIEARKEIVELKSTYNKEAAQEISKELDLNTEKENASKNTNKKNQKTAQKQQNKDASIQL